MSQLREDELYSEDFDNVCRLCLARDPDNIQIFCDVGQSYKLQEKLYKQFNFWVRPEGRIPKTVCKACLSQVESFHHYALKVDAVQRRLHRLSQEERCCVDIFKRGNIQNSKSLANTGPSTVFSTDFDENFELVYHDREQLTTPTDYSYQPQHVQVPNKIQASTSEQTSTEIEVEVDPLELHSYGDESNDSDYVEDHLYSKESSKNVEIGNEKSVDYTKSECQSTDDNVMVNSNVESSENINKNEELEEGMSQKRNDSCAEDSEESNDYDSDSQENPKNGSEKSDQEKFNRSCRWSKKCSFTEEHLDRSRKSKKIREQLDSFFDYVCFECEQPIKFTNFLLLKNHCRDVHNKKAQVTCCKRKLTERKALIHHMLTKHLQPDEFSCPQCGKSVSTQHMLKLHIINHLPESQRPFKCSQCGKGFCSIPYVRKHEKNHHFSDDPMGTFICDECGKSFIYERKLYVHKRNLHSKVENPVMCHICAKTFKHHSALRSHLMTHKKGRTEECPYCHKYFKNTDTVRSHIKQEHRVSPAHCEPCNKTFRSKRKLVCHTKVFHSNEKPYQCNICNRYFKLRSGLKTHMVQHTGEKPYQCPYCPRTFASSGNWSTHKKRMHGEIKSVSSYEPQME